MKKFMNDPAHFAVDSLDGFVAAHGDLISFGPDGNFVRRKQPGPPKVAVISGGGAGHEPLHVGFVGRGMLDAACSGHLFTSPTPDKIVAAIEACDQGLGTLLIVKNYDGDVMNFDMAADQATRGGRQVRTVIVADDASGGSRNRRGVAGTLFVEKIIGAAAEEGRSLDELALLGARAATSVSSIGVALRGASLPTAIRETFVLGEGELEFGVGIHGEAGCERLAMRSAPDIITMICERLLTDIGDHHGQLLLFVNGLGSTPQSELYLAYGLARNFWAQRGFNIVRSLTGSYVTSLDMAGLSITVARLDDELTRLWDATVVTPALRW